MNEERRRLAKAGIDPVQGNQHNVSGYQGPSVKFHVDHLSGQVVASQTTGKGCDPLAEFPNAQPAPAPRSLSNALDFRNGGPGTEMPTAPFNHPSLIGKGAINFLQLDPEVLRRPGGDQRDRRGTENKAAIFG